MTKVTMPEHWAERIAEGSAVDFWWQNGTKGIKVGEKLITTEQAEAYAEARVRRALEQAMTEAAKISNQYGYGYSGHEVDAVDEVIDAIRALIPKENKS